MNGTKLEQKVAEYIAGGRRAFDYIYECTNRAVYFAALYTVRDKGYAEDVMQETFLKLYRQVLKITPRALILRRGL